MDIVGNFKQTAGVMTDLLSGTTPEQMSLPTPCVEWSVRELVAHIIDNLAPFAEWAGAPIPPAHAEAGLVARYNQAVDVILDAYTAAGTLERALPTPFGDLPGGAVLGVCFADQLTHVWDLAQATGRSVQVDDGLADDAIKVWEGFIQEGLRNGSTFATPQPAGPSASALDHLAAFTGRTV